MSMIVSLSVPSSKFIFGGAFSDDPNAEIRLECDISISDSLLPYIWVSGVQPDRIERELSSQTDVKYAEVIDQDGDNALVRITWQTTPEGLISLFEKSQVTVLEGIRSSGRWEFTLRFPDHEALSAFHQRCLNTNFQVKLNWIQDPAYPGERTSQFGLTDAQQEALILAFDVGYFSIPREMTLGTFAEQVGVSDTAISQRLRRGTAALVENTLITSNESKHR